jgi:hypothetical protein
VVDVFTALSNAQGLRHLNLYHDFGLTGPLVPPLSGGRAGLCSMVRRGLTGLTADGVGLTGSLPPCLLSNSSRLVELHLGAPACPCPCPCSRPACMHQPACGAKELLLRLSPDGVFVRAQATTT